MFRSFLATSLAAALVLASLPAGATIPGYPCYRTVEETESALANIAAAHPSLASVVDIGDSWEKSEPGGSWGYDIYCLCLTNSAVPGPKPIVVVTAAVEPKDMASAELALRVAEYLGGAHGTDADATWLLDYHEIHIIPVANPDGRKHVESGLYWYKNTNEGYCSPTSDYRGANLDRNFPFQWNCCGGSSSNACNNVYHGPAAASEPETQALRNYLEYVFADSRPADTTTPAPDTTMGIVIDLKAAGGMMLWSWGFSGTNAPNHTALQTLGRKLAYSNAYTPERQVDLFPTDGSLLDFAYGELGVATYAVHLGTAMFEGCATFESTVLPDNMDMLLAAARLARAPYLLPSGPDAVDPEVSEPMSGNVTITATIDDTRFSTAGGAEPTQNIADAEFYMDTPPWVDSPVPVSLPMWPVDGSFDSAVEDVTVTLNVSALPPGKHIIFVRGQDAGGSWGAVSAVFLDLPSSGITPEGGGGAPGIQCRVHPVPSASSATLELTMPRAAFVTVEILDMRGRCVRTLSGEALGAGAHTFTWDGLDAAGRTAAPGVYAMRVVAGSETRTVKAVLLR